MMCHLPLFLRAPLVAAAFALILTSTSTAAQDAASTPRLTQSEMETFLLTAKVVATTDAGAGVTDSIRATLSDGRLTHDAHVQSVNISRPLFQAGAYTEINFKDSYRFNIAAYRLARLLQIAAVPVAVEREIGGKTSAVSWWVDDVQMDEKERLTKQTMGPDSLRTSNQIQLMYIWDELIQNRDRNTGNIVWTHDWTLWLIDHTRAFRLDDDLMKPERLLRCDRDLFGRLKLLTDESIEQAAGDALQKAERQAILKRRDRIVTIIEQRAAKFGRGAVFFDFQSHVRSESPDLP